MPVMNGIELSRKIIETKASQKVIVISAHSETKYFIDLIDIGISSFIQKPLKSDNMVEVLSKVCFELKEEEESFRHIKLLNGVQWDSQMKILMYQNKTIELSANEIKVMNLLISNRGHIFSSVDIFNYIYLKDPEKEFSKDSIKSLLKRLRQKIDAPLIQTHKNLGFSISS